MAKDNSNANLGFEKQIWDAACVLLGHIPVYGQEPNADTWKMAKINMAIRGIDADFGPYHADTFSHDWANREEL